MNSKPLSSYLSDLQSGSRPRGGVKFINSGVPSIGGEHLNNLGNFDFDSIKYVPEDFAKSMTKGKIQEHDILIVKDGATTGKVSYVDASFPYDNSTVNEHVFILRTNEKIISKFLFWYLWSKDGQNEILKNFQGSAQGGINRTFIDAVAVPEFSSNDQRIILEKINSVIPPIFSNNKKLEEVQILLTKFRKSIFLSAFKGELTEKWRKAYLNIEPAKELLKKIALKLDKKRGIEEKSEVEFIWNIFSEIPDTWIHCRLGDIGIVSNGSTPSRSQNHYWNGDIPWVSSGEVNNNIISLTREKITKDGYDNSSVKLYPKGTVLLAMIGEGKTRGRSAILEIEATTNQNTAAIILDHGMINSKYLWYWFQFQYEVTRNYGSGSGPQALSCARVRALPFILAPMEEQLAIVIEIEKYLNVLTKVERQIDTTSKKAEKITQAILAKAFRGELIA